MSFPAYPEYKDSGVEWLGDVPSHWHIDRFKRSTASCKNGVWGSEPCDDGNDIECVRVADFDRQSLTTYDEIPTLRNVSDKERTERILSRGNLLLEKSGGGDLQPVGFVVLYDRTSPAICSNFVARVELADGMVPSFWRYCHAASYAVRLNCRSIKQTSGIQNLDQSQYLDELAPFPPESEQRAIAEFLDRETAKIDALVAEQRRLIELLKEKRQAVISHAVTKGLNPDAPMKDSGIEWLGDVPKHWEVRRFRTLANVVRGASPRPAGDPKYFNGDYVPWVTVAEITKDNGKYLSATESFLTEQGAIHSRTFEPNTLLYTNSGATLGVPKILAIRACANDGVIGFLEMSDTADISYLYYFLTSITEAIREKVKQGSGQPNLNTDIVKALTVPLPPMTEQTQIIGFIENVCHDFECLIREADHAIELLQERRTALISAAVTGKIDVRGAVPEGVG